LSRPIASCALVALTFAVQGLLPGSSSADVGPGGWGIADDFHVPPVSLNQSFDELAPKSFRFIATWDQLNDPAYRGQVQSKIDEANAAARGPGGMEIAVSFSVPPQTWQGVPITGQAWIDQVIPFIAKFSSDVEWWSPMNEPGLQGWTFTPSGASKVADFSVRLKNYLQQSQPADKLLSPDFNDHYNADGTLKRHLDGTSFVERYVKLFDKAGGEFGSAVSWHAHGAVRFKSLLSTDDLVTTLAATKAASLPVWVTEAGAHLDDSRVPGQTEAQQDDQVKWMVDTNSGLASHDRITRMSYYHVRQDTDVTASPCKAWPNPWDTALVTACGKRRLAWYTWCLAARQGDAACYDASPTVASWGPTRLDVLWAGNTDDTAVYRKSWDGAAWSSIGSLGGTTSSAPAVVAPADRRLEVYARGGDNGVWYRRYDGVGWSNWTALGGQTYSSPAASARRGTSIVDVFARGTDNLIYQRFRSGTAWSGWTSIASPPGGATSAPAAVSNANGRIDVFVRGGDSAIWQKTWTGSWGPWRSAGGAATSAPTVVSRGPNNLILFFRAADGQIYQRTDAGAGWLDRGSLGGATLSAPGAVAANADRIDVWTRGTDNAIQHKVWKSSSGWGSWSGAWFAGP
jgi:Glycosyl hydrolase catalytic core